MFSDQHLVLLGICTATINIATTDCLRGGLHPTACLSPRPSPGPVLYALATSQPAHSRQTPKRSNRFTHLLLLLLRLHIQQTSMTQPQQSVLADDICQMSYFYCVFASCIFPYKFSEKNIRCTLFSRVAFFLLRASGKIRPASDLVFTLTSVKWPRCFSQEFTSQPRQRRRASQRARHFTFLKTATQNKDSPCYI